MVYITARKVVDDEVVFVPSDDLTAPVLAPNNTALPSAPLPNSGTSIKAVRARRSAARKSGAHNGSRRVSSRLANKQQVAAFLFVASPVSTSSDSPTISVSFNTEDKEAAGILGDMDQEVASAAPFEALALLADGADALQAAAVNTSVLESLSPARGDSSDAAGDKSIKEAVCAPQTTLDTFFSAKSSILGKRKAEDGEVDSVRDAAATVLAVEELEYQAGQFNAALDSAKEMLEKLVATRLAGEKKRRRVSCKAPTTGAVNPTDITAPSCPSFSVPAGKGKKNSSKKHGVARKVVTKKAAAGGAGGATIRRTATKNRVDPCLPVGMEVVFLSENAVYGSIASEDNIRKSGRIQSRRKDAAAKTSAHHRRKQGMPAIAALW